MQKNTGLVFNSYIVKRKLLRSGRVKKVKMLLWEKYPIKSTQGEEWSCCLHGRSPGVSRGWGGNFSISCQRLGFLICCSLLQLMEMAGNFTAAAKLKIIKPRHIKVWEAMNKTLKSTSPVKFGRTSLLSVSSWWGLWIPGASWGCQSKTTTFLSRVKQCYTFG